MNLSGIFPPLTTPFGDDGRLLPRKLRSNIERYNLTGLAGYVVLGSTGEAIYLTTEEKRHVLSTAREAASENKLLIAGTGEESLEAALDMTRHAADLGYDAALVRTPFYYKNAMTPAAEVTFFKMVADSSPIPILIYNVPGFTGIDLTVETVAELAEHPNIHGIKESSGSLEKVTRMLQLTAKAPAKSVVAGMVSRRAAGLRPFAGEVASPARPDVLIETIAAERPSYKDKSVGFQVLVGNAPTLYPSFCAGATGSVLALTAAAPIACLDILQAYRDGEHAIARCEQQRVLDAAAVIAQLGVPAVKYALDLNGYYGGPARAPMLPLTRTQKDRVEAAFANVTR